MISQEQLKARIKDEYKKCLNSPSYFMKKYCYIQHPTKGRILFKLYDFQETTLEDFKNYDRNIVLKSRQLGISTLSSGYALWTLLFHRDKFVLCLAPTQQKAKNLVTKINFMHQNLPSWLRDKNFEEKNKLSMRFSNGSQVIAASGDSDAARGEAVSLLIADEFAFLSSASELWASAQQTLATGGQAILLSTPNGAQGQFFEMWNEAEAGKNGFHTIRLDWRVHPDRNQKWRDAQTMQLGPRLANQECVSGNTQITLLDTITKNESKKTIKELYDLLEGSKTKENKRYRVLTSEGYQLFSGIKRTTKSKSITIKFTNTEITCSENHRFFRNGKIIEAKKLKAGQFVESEYGVEKVIRIKTNTKKTELYDLLNVGNDSAYFTNSLLSHNCDASFLTSGNGIIEGPILKWYEENHVKDPIVKRGVDGNIWVWEEAQPGKNYLIAADVARGDGSDYSAFHVINLENLEQVAEYKGQIGTTEYGQMLVALAYEYNQALLVVENASIGWATIQKIIDLNYPNLFYSQKDLHIIDPKIQLSKNVDLKDKEDLVPGFTTSAKTRPLIISNLETLMRERLPIIHSKRLIAEFFTFVWLNGKPEAAKGYNDDLTMAWSIGLWVRDTALRLKEEGIKITRLTLETMKKTQAVYTPKQNIGYNPWKTPDGRGGTTDLTWLVG